MGFFTVHITQSLVVGGYSRNPFQGGMGFFTQRRSECWLMILRLSRNPFQGGMGFFTKGGADEDIFAESGRNPFQGGMGFFTRG